MQFLIVSFCILLSLTIYVKCSYDRMNVLEQKQSLKMLQDLKLSGWDALSLVCSESKVGIGSLFNWFFIFCRLLLRLECRNAINFALKTSKTISNLFVKFADDLFENCGIKCQMSSFTSDFSNVDENTEDEDENEDDDIENERELRLFQGDEIIEHSSEDDEDTNTEESESEIESDSDDNGNGSDVDENDTLVCSQP